MGEPWPGVREAERVAGRRGRRRRARRSRRSAASGRPSTTGWLAEPDAQDQERRRARPTSSERASEPDATGPRAATRGTEDRNAGEQGPSLEGGGGSRRSASRAWSARARNPMGLDVGTSKIVAARKSGKEIQTAAQLNAFIPVPFSPVHREDHPGPERHLLLPRRRRARSSTAPPPSASRTCSTPRCRRPMADGLLNPREKSAMPVLEAILADHGAQGADQRRDPLLLRARGDRRARSRSSPTTRPPCAGTSRRLRLPRGGHQRGPGRDLLRARGPELHRHRHLLRRRHVQRHPRLPVDPLASCSASPRAATSSTPRWASVVDEHATRVKVSRKRASTSPSRPRTSSRRRSTSTTRTSWRPWWSRSARRIAKAEKLPETDRPLPIVLSGGTAKPRGFKELFERTLRARTLPIEVAEVRMATDPLTATARGALIAAHVREVGRGPPAATPGRGPRRDRVPPVGPFALSAATLTPCDARPLAPRRRCWLCAAPPGPLEEWYDYYLDARDKHIPAGRTREASTALQEAVRLKPTPGLNEVNLRPAVRRLPALLLAGRLLPEDRATTRAPSASSTSRRDRGAIQREPAPQGPLRQAERGRQASGAG